MPQVLLERHKAGREGGGVGRVIDYTFYYGCAGHK